MDGKEVIQAFSEALAKGVAKMDMTGIDIYEVKGGRITGVWLFSQDQKVEDNFWGR